MAKNYDEVIEKNQEQIKKLTEANKVLMKKKKQQFQKERERFAKQLLKIYEKHFGKIEDEKILEVFDLALEESKENIKEFMGFLQSEEPGTGVEEAPGEVQESSQG